MLAPGQGDDELTPPPGDDELTPAPELDVVAPVGSPCTLSQMSRSMLSTVGLWCTILAISSGKPIRWFTQRFMYVRKVLVSGCLPSGQPGQSESTVAHFGLHKSAKVCAKPHRSPRSHLPCGKNLQSFTCSNLLRIQDSSGVIPGGGAMAGAALPAADVLTVDGVVTDPTLAL